MRSSGTNVLIETKFISLNEKAHKAFFHFKMNFFILMGQYTKASTEGV